MNIPDVTPTGLPDVLMIEPRRFADGRGFFSEVYNARALAGAGIDMTFVQDNQSLSERAGTLRGLHYQTPPAAQAKLVRCGRGAIWDVAVDFRRDSDTFGQWIGMVLSAENGRQLLIPEGFLHGFVTLEQMTEVLYKCSAPYDPAADRSIAWDSAGIDWPLDGRVPVLSEKDAKAPKMADVQSPFGGGS